MNTREQQLKAFNDLLNVMDDLREKCPWDKKQTFESLRTNTLEEVYELTDAIAQGDLNEIKKELGDVLLHIVFYSKIASETQSFDIGDVAAAITQKLIDRHPHIYGETVAENEEQVLQNWEKLKLKEGNKSVLSGVPKALPTLIKAYRIQQKVSGVGFDFPVATDALAKVNEEIKELTTEVDSGNLDKAEAEFGDVLFSLINYARFLNINPETALERTNTKFINRFQYIETVAKNQGKAITDLSLQEMDVIWEQAKKELK
ncbi:nucleoside triphosphate pyrophosphohydrolase [Flavobacterium agricola]|uniref:Nucleoside triphosphate pyrophosphohydrolase n=1 Tax=Flavobacterium agricola TaxID=2870839 RepID=A0ABY6M2J7_9FLAO|nr:nucleoside triphosphate pyrophosphohydrolase [Flavobacterium agricola]UYW01645.1 nucleoside triphosphate pyrophosphohydrolase [Flavobacterium agricola]